MIEERKKSLFKYPSGTLIKKSDDDTLMLIIQSYYKDEIYAAYKVLSFVFEYDDGWERENFIVLESYWAEYLESKAWSVIK